MTRLATNLRSLYVCWEGQQSFPGVPIPDVCLSHQSPQLFSDLDPEAIKVVLLTASLSDIQ